MANKNIGKKYITLDRDNGIDFRKIAKIMSRNGYAMNHATARNVLIQSARKLFNNISQQLGTNLSEEAIEEILQKQQTHDALADVLYLVYHKEKREFPDNMSNSSKDSFDSPRRVRPKNKPYKRDRSFNPKEWVNTPRDASDELEDEDSLSMEEED